MERISAKIWSGKNTAAPNTEKHRFALMITDGLTEERDSLEWTSVVKKYNFDLGVLLIREPNHPDNRGLLEVVASAYEVLNTKAINEMSVVLANLITRQFMKVIQKIELAAANKPSAPHASIIAVPQLKKDAPTIYPVDRTVGSLDFSNALQKGVTQPKLMFYASEPDAAVPYATEVAKQPRSTDALHQELADVNYRLQKYYFELSSTINMRAAILDAERAWKAAESKLFMVIEDMQTVMEDAIFPINKFSRRRADYRGPSLYLPGLIKAVITDFNYKKFFAAKKAGGKRNYSVVIALDVSLSMNGM